MPIAYQIMPDRFVDDRHGAFSEGARAAGFVVEDATRMRAIQGREGDILLTWNLHGYKEEIARGFERGGGRVIVAEEGYTRKLWAQKHFAVAISGHNGSGYWRSGAWDRWAKTGLKLKPWRAVGSGDYILVCGQRGIGTRLMRSPPDWHEHAAAEIRKHTDRPVLVRTHPGKSKNKASVIPLAEQLVNAYCVVVWSSASVVQALIEGIPCIYQAPHHVLAGAMTNDISLVADPPHPIREPTFKRMAYAQWTIDEIRSGEAFKWLLH